MPLREFGVHFPMQKRAKIRSRISSVTVLAGNFPESDHRARAVRPPRSPAVPLPRDRGRTSPQRVVGAQQCFAMARIDRHDRVVLQRQAGGREPAAAARRARFRCLRRSRPIPRRTRGEVRRAIAPACECACARCRALQQLRCASSRDSRSTLVEHHDAVFRRRVRMASISASVGGRLASNTCRTTSALGMALAAALDSEALDRIFAVAATRRCPRATNATPFNRRVSRTTSRVVPGCSVTIERGDCTSRLNRLLLPTFGAPARLTRTPERSISPSPAVSSNASTSAARRRRGPAIASRSKNSSPSSTKSMLASTSDNSRGARRAPAAIAGSMPRATARAPRAARRAIAPR